MFVDNGIGFRAYAVRVGPRLRSFLSCCCRIPGTYECYEPCLGNLLFFFTVGPVLSLFYLLFPPLTFLFLVYQCALLQHVSVLFFSTMHLS